MNSYTRSVTAAASLIFGLTFVERLMPAVETGKNCFNSEEINKINI